MDHKDLVVWKKAMELVEEIYRVSKEFPDHEKYGLTNQIRMAFAEVGIKLDFRGDGLQKEGIIVSCANPDFQLKQGKVVVKIDPDYYIP